MQRILVLGAGFAGLWAAVAAARKLDELGIGPEGCEVTVVNPDPWHCIRVRNYEADLSDVRVRLDDVLGPIGVKRVEAEVVDIDTADRIVSCIGAAGPKSLPYDRLVFALGSRLTREAVPGLLEHGFDIDTYPAAARLARHLRTMAGKHTVLVIGAGLTGVEAAADMVDRVGAAGRVILADHGARIGSDMGDGACEVIGRALADLGVETRTGVAVVSVDEAGVALANGERIEAATVIWCAGMRAHPLAASFPVTLDRLGRVPVDPFLKVEGLTDVFAAGDCARAMFSGGHASVMSCQHGRPMGRHAGHNAACDLLGLEMLPLDIAWYVTVLDLGRWGAVYTEGWERRVVASGAAAKATKQEINQRRIYPPRGGDRRAIFQAASPVVQTPPPR